MQGTNTRPFQVVAWHWHWRFWEPVQCSGGQVRFGLYADCQQPGSDRIIHDSVADVGQKRQLGVIDQKP